MNWTDRGFVISQATDYPNEGATTLRVEEGAGQLDFRLRVPAWVEKGSVVRINGVAQPVEAAPGSYVSMDRQRAPGDTIEISMPLSFRVETTPRRP